MQLDVVSPDRYFTEIVPRLALRDDVLYYACLAYASRVLVLRGELEEPQEQSYEGKAIEVLIPRLSVVTQHGPQTQEGAILATTVVILRMSEQFSEIRDDAQRHLFGASSLFATRSGGDETASDTAPFILYLRQSIRIAFLNEKPCSFAGYQYRNNICLSPCPDYVWVNRMTVLVPRICSVCWDASLSDTIRDGILEQLSKSMEQWRESVPATFDPWCHYRREQDVFPVICFISPWHGKPSPTALLRTLKF